MAIPDTPAAPITLPAPTVIRLAELLTDLDKFLRSSRRVTDELATFLAHHGHRHPAFDAHTLIDQLGFAAVHLRQLADGTSAQAAESTHHPLPPNPNVIS